MSGYCKPNNLSKAAELIDLGELIPDTLLVMPNFILNPYTHYKVRHSSLKHFAINRDQYRKTTTNRNTEKK